MWLHVPSTSSVCVPESEALIEGCDTGCGDQAAWFAMWRGKPFARQSLPRGAVKILLFARLSGLTLKPSTLSLGAASWISSLQGTPVSPGLAPESAKAPMTLAISGPTLRNTFAQLDLRCFSAKTSQDTCPWGSTKSFKNYQQWATSLRQAYSQRQKLAHPISENDCSLLLTPTAAAYGTQRTAIEIANGKTRYSLNSMAARGIWPTPKTTDSCQGYAHHARRMGKRGMIKELRNEVMMWPTPTVKGDYNKAGLTTKSGDGLATAVKMWPTPRASTGGARKTPRETSNGIRLQEAVQQWPTPTASDGTCGGPNQRYSSGGCNLAAAAAKQALPVKGTLNPDWVELLQGLPTGWTSISGEAHGKTALLG